jgi:NADH-quinone oxidoreductase subunit C
VDRGELTLHIVPERIAEVCRVMRDDESLRFERVTGVYPTADWQERETYDMFGVVFDGHPNLTRILMPDDWEGHPQRKDYPLGGVPVEYKGAEIPPPDRRRSYQ